MVQWFSEKWEQVKGAGGAVVNFCKEGVGKVVGIFTGKTAENGEKWLNQMTGAGKTAITLAIIALIAIVIMYIFWVYKNKVKRKTYEEVVKEKNRVEDIVFRQQIKSAAIPDKIYIPPAPIQQNGFAPPPNQHTNTAIGFGKDK